MPLKVSQVKKTSFFLQKYRITKEEIMKHSCSSCTVAVMCLKLGAAESARSGAYIAVLVKIN